MNGTVRARVLVAALGSTLRGDDGFGPALLARIGPVLPSRVDAVDFGTQGIALLQTLHAGYDALILLDACVRGGTPGTVYVLAPETATVPPAGTVAGLDAFADAHLADPARVLALARALDVLPRTVWLVGCEPGSHDGHHIGLSEPVARALPSAAAETLALLHRVQEQHEAGE